MLNKKLSGQELEDLNTIYNKIRNKYENKYRLTLNLDDEKIENRIDDILKARRERTISKDLHNIIKMLLDCLKSDKNENSSRVEFDGK